MHFLGRKEIIPKKQEPSRWSIINPSMLWAQSNTLELFIIVIPQNLIMNYIKQLYENSFLGDRNFSPRQELRRQTRSQVQLGQWSRMRGTGENMDGDLGFHFTGEAEGARGWSYPLTIGMDGATGRWTKLWKGTSAGPRKVCFFRNNLHGSSLKDVIMRR